MCIITFLAPPMYLYMNPSSSLPTPAPQPPMLITDSLPYTHPARCGVWRDHVLTLIPAYRGKIDGGGGKGSQSTILRRKELWGPFCQGYILLLLLLWLVFIFVVILRNCNGSWWTMILLFISSILSLIPHPFLLLFSILAPHLSPSHSANLSLPLVLLSSSFLILYLYHTSVFQQP